MTINDNETAKAGTPKAGTPKAGTPKAETPKTAQAGKSFVAALLGYFASLKLTLMVLLTMAVVSIIGTVVEQGKDEGFYVMEYGDEWAGIIETFSFGDMYHSVWFTFILVMLVVNIVSCTIERFPVKWKKLHKDTQVFDTSIIDKLSKKDTFSAAGSVAETRDALKGFLKGKKYNVRVKENGSGYSLYAWKGLIGRFGSDFTHLSLLVILLGAIIGSFVGYRDFNIVHIGDQMEVPDAEFQVRLDEFWIEYYDSGQIKQYNSNLTVIEGGEEVLKKHIWVNEPLYYKGIRFYQSSYGKAWDRIAEAEVALIKNDNIVGEPVTLGWQAAPVSLPDVGYSIKVISYVSDFAFDPDSKTVWSKSGEVNNPAVQIEVYEDALVVSRPWLFFNYPAQFESLPKSGINAAGEYNLVLSGFRNIMYSGIALNKDPGTNVVWVGSGIMGIGFYLAFFVYYRRYWFEVSPESDKTVVRLGGMMNKNLLLFEREFKELRADIRKAAGAEVLPAGATEGSEAGASREKTQTKSEGQG